MTDREKVIRGLNCCKQSVNLSDSDCVHCPYKDEGQDCWYKMMDDAIELLEAQDTRKTMPVKRDENTYTGEPVFKCPKCYAPLDTCFDFCPSCGQAVKWR